MVVGAGIMGLLCAYRLRRHGRPVTLIDAGPPGGACSAGNAGWITRAMAGPLPAPGVVGQSLRWMLHRDSPLHIRPRAVPALAGWLWLFSRHCNPRDYAAGLEAIAGLNRWTLGLFDELAADLAFEMHAQGMLYAFLSPRALEHTHADLERVQAQGGPDLRRLTAAGTRELEPALGDGVIGGVMVAQERHVRPETLTAALWNRLAPDPEVALVRAAATGFAVRRDRVVAARTPAGDVEGDAFLLAAGAWSGELARGLGARLPVQGGKGYSVTVQAPALRLRQPLYLDEARVACSPFADALRLAGTMEFAGLQPAVDPRRVQAMARASDAYLPGWRRGGKTVAWSGLRPVTPDGLPAIGRLPSLENAYVATGHAMLGITLAPATAMAVTRLMCGGSVDAELGPFDPGRFGASR